MPNAHEITTLEIMTRIILSMIARVYGAGDYRDAAVVLGLPRLAPLAMPLPAGDEGESARIGDRARRASADRGHPAAGPGAG
ncbi:hypothetical protein GCM10010170_039630 [Dactylosporangium salmoneum]|uniref:Uncharacterized protein n=1 Tax=Dactylosporangium salmoneum TaxID=53361 RepID=A0ABP5TDX7_9ACTN